jgi:ribosomal protein S18 acetylase RimI-like enzyme
MRGVISDTKNILMAAWREYAEAFPTRFQARHPEMDIACGGIAVPLFNLAFPKTAGVIRPAELERLLREFGEILASHNIPGLLFVRADRVEAPVGLEAMFRMPGMVAGELLSPKYKQEELDIREVADLEMAAMISQLNAAAHGMAPEDAAAMTCTELWRAPNHGFLLYADGAAVAAGAAAFVEGVSYVGWMATRAGFRGRGYAEAILRHMDAFMKRRYGVTESVLHATELGRHVYERVGFRAVDEYAGYLCVATANAAVGSNPGLLVTDAAGGFDGVEAEEG